MRIFCHTKIVGLSNLAPVRGKTVLLVSNHVHEFDPAIVPSVIPQSIIHSPVFFVSREKSFYKDIKVRGKIYGGIFFTALGAYQVYTGLKDYARSLVNHLRILSDGGSVYIFPEGKVTKTGEMQEFRSGVGFLAHESQVPVVPVHIGGIWDMGLREFLSRKRTLTVTIGTPLHYSDLFAQTDASANEHIYKQATNAIREAVAQLAPVQSN